MATISSGDGESERHGKAAQYAPSWIDRFTDWVEHRPWPSWSYYLGVGAGFLVLQAFILWLEGALPFGVINIAQGYLAVAITFMLALVHYLDRRAGMTLATMRPALLVNDKAFHRLSYRLTTLPARMTLLAGLATLVFVFLSESIGEPYKLEELTTFPVSANFLRFVYLACWWIFGTFLYHTIHQLRVISLIYTRYTRVDLLRVKPLYGFSTIAALTAGSLAMIAYGWLLANPWIDRSDPMVFIPMVVLIFSAVATFIWPQLGIHTLQVAEKDRMQDEANLRLEAMISELHRQVDNREFAGMEDLNMAMASLEIELNTLRKTPTWPWEPEVLQLLITALALPLGLWLLQLILERTISS